MCGEPILEVGNPVWSKAGISYSMAIMHMIGGWAKEQNDNGASEKHTWQPALELYKGGGN